MTAEELDTALRAVHRLRPFRSFVIEFVSGDRLTVAHPEAVMRWGESYLYFGPDRSRRIFGADGVCQILFSTAPSR